MCSGINTVMAGYAYITVGVITFNIIRSSSVIIIVAIYALLEKKMPSLKKISGIILGLISILLIIYSK